MAKLKSTLLNVDFIGGQEPLTQEELLAISAFFKNQKKKNTLRKTPSRSTSKSRIKTWKHSDLKSQFVTSKGGVRKLPWVYTEQDYQLKSRN